MPDRCISLSPLADELLLSFDFITPLLEPKNASKVFSPDDLYLLRNSFRFCYFNSCSSSSVSIECICLPADVPRALARAFLRSRNSLCTLIDKDLPTVSIIYYPFNMVFFNPNSSEPLLCLGSTCDWSFYIYLSMSGFLFIFYEPGELNFIDEPESTPDFYALLLMGLFIDAAYSQNYLSISWSTSTVLDLNNYFWEGTYSDFNFFILNLRFANLFRF